eukprot:SAG22_NODE_6894_length_797_cov_2.654728_2_plen_78_part_00
MYTLSTIAVPFSARADHPQRRAGALFNATPTSSVGQGQAGGGITAILDDQFETISVKAFYERARARAMATNQADGNI